jgi:hypothetical protein
MAKPSWLNVTPQSGSGNGSISNSANAHTGRVARTSTVTVTGVGVGVPATYKVIQTPKEEFASFDNGAEMSAPKSGGAVTVTGKTNSSKLTFRWNGEVTDVTIPETYQANGTATNNGEAIANDPGANAEIAFSIEFTFPANATIEEVERVLIVEANGGQSAQIIIKQAAGDATLSVDPTEITIPQDGSAVSVQVMSNTSWTVS